MKKIIVCIASLAIVGLIMSTGLTQWWVYFLVMCVHFNGIPAPTWLVMAASYQHGLVMIPIMFIGWTINSIAYFWYWRWVIFYRLGVNQSAVYTEEVENAAKNSRWRFKRRILKTVAAALQTKVQWWHVFLIRLIPIPASGGVPLCAGFASLKTKHYAIGNGLAILITTVYFSLLIDAVKASSLPQSIKILIYFLHLS